MKIEHKKRIAKEILIFFCSTAVILIFIAFFTLWNATYFEHHRVINIEIRKVRNEIDSLIYANLNEWEADSSELIPPALKLKNDEINALKVEANRVQDKEISRDFAIFVIITLLILAYPVRFIVLTIRWAIKTLRA